MRKTFIAAISIMLMLMAFVSCTNNGDPGFKGDADEVVQNLKPADIVKDVLSKDGKGVSVEYRLIEDNSKAVTDGSYILRATVTFTSYAVPNSSYSIIGGTLIYDFRGTVTDGRFRAAATCTVSTQDKLEVDTDNGIAEVSITDDNATVSSITTDVSNVEVGEVVENVTAPTVTMDRSNATVTVGNETVDDIPAPTPSEPDDPVVRPAAINTEEELRAAAASGSGEYYLTKDFPLTTQLDIKAPITLDGRGFTISRKIPTTPVGEEEGWGTKAVILITADGTSLRNLKVSGTGTPSTAWNPGEFGIKVWDAGNVSLEDITVTNLNAGIQVNSSTVMVSGTMTVSDNEYGGIGVDQGSNLSTPGKLILANGVEIVCTDTDVPAIWLESDAKADIEGDLTDLLSYIPADRDGQIYYITESFTKTVAKNDTQKAAYATLNDAVTNAASGDKITLLNNVELASRVEVRTAITLDLAGHTISIGEGFPQANTGMITVYEGGSLTVDDSIGEGTIDATKEASAPNSDVEVGNYVVSTAVLVFQKTLTPAPVLTVNGGTIIGATYGISGNGSAINGEYPAPTITLNGGTIISREGTGIYHPQAGTITINDGVEITGKRTALEVRGGTATINGGIFTSETAPENVTPNGNGPTSEGAAMAIAQHTHKQPVTVNISGGTFNGFSAVYQSNPQNNPDEDIEKVTIKITGGTFNATNEGTKVIYSENLEDFIIGGRFSIQPDANYIAEGYTAQQSGNVWVVE